MYTALNILRAIAALVVFAAHLRGLNLPEYGQLPPDQQTIWIALAYACSRPGHAAVLIFFVLSGFLVGGQVARRISDRSFSIGQYTMDRATRILLPLVPAIALASFVSLLESGKLPSVVSILLHTVGLNGVVTPTILSNGPLWSLSYEIWFYVIAGIVGYVFTQRTMNVTIILFMIGGVLVFCVLKPLYLLFWFLGVLASRQSSKGAINRVVSLFGLSLFIGGLVLTELTSQSRYFNAENFITRDGASAMMCIGLAAILPALCDPRLTLVLKPVEALARFTSGISFSLYVFHYPILKLLNVLSPPSLEWNDQSLIATGIKMICTVVGCVLLYFLFEANTVRLRATLSRFSRRNFSR